MISLTDLAKKELKEIAEKEGITDPFVRLSIKGAGCAGFSYDMCFVPTSLDTDEIIEIENVNFKFIIDPVSYQYLEDCTIDYLDTLIGAGFKFSNPKATGSCGCGNSVNF